MTITKYDGGDGVSTTNSITLTVTAPTAGYLMFLIVFYAKAAANTSTITVPAGWTLVQRDDCPSNATSGAVYSKVATGSEGTSLTVTLDGAAPSVFRASAIMFGSDIGTIQQRLISAVGSNSVPTLPSFDYAFPPYYEMRSFANPSGQGNGPLPNIGGEGSSTIDGAGFTYDHEVFNVPIGRSSGVRACELSVSGDWIFYGIAVTDKWIVSVAVLDQWSASAGAVYRGHLSQLGAYGTYNDATTQALENNAVTPMVWTSTDPSKATVDTTGLATAVLAGATVVKATYNPGDGSAVIDSNVGGSNYALTIPGVTSIILLDQNSTTGPSTGELGVPFQFLAYVHWDDMTEGYDSGEATWSSTDHAVATLDSVGMSSPLSLGSTTIMASLDGVDSNTILFTVGLRHVPTITSASAFPTVQIGHQMRSELYITLDDASTVDVAADAWAPLTEYAVGVIVLTGGHAYRCTTAGTSSSSAPTSIDPDTVTVDGTVHWLVVAVVATPPAWTSSAPSIATVNASTGVVTGIALGTTTIHETTTGATYAIYVVPSTGDVVHSTTPPVPIAAPIVYGDPTYVDHVTDALDRLREQFKPTED